jgi:hypothetical protein
MTKEIFEKNNPHPDIGKQKFRVGRPTRHLGGV